MASNEVEVLDPAGTVERLKKIASGRSLNRRHFMAALGMTGAAAGAGLIAGCSSGYLIPPATPENSSTIAGTSASSDVLNFALNLEYLEATFYSYVTQGADLPASLTGGSAAVTGNPSKLTFTGTNAAQITDLLNEIYFDEMSHVADLRSVLGSNAIPRPAINLAAAGAVTASNALSLARQFEDVGATAYAGAAALLDSTNLSYAAQILAVEGFHAGALRLVSIQNPGIALYANTGDGLDVQPFDPGSATLAAAGPTGSGGFFATAGTSNASASVPAGFAFTRTTSQVLAIVYSSAPGVPAVSGTSKGGFFPNGVNGAITTV